MTHDANTFDQVSLQKKGKAQQKAREMRKHMSDARCLRCHFPKLLLLLSAYSWVQAAQSNKKTHYNKLTRAEQAGSEPLMLQSFWVSLAHTSLFLPWCHHRSAAALPKGKPKRASV